MSFGRDKNGRWKQIRPIPGDNIYHQNGILETLNALDPLFYQAQQKNEIGFILTLLRYKKDQPAGWDTLINLRELYESFEKIRTKLRYNKTHAHFHLFIYGLIIEASEPYEVIANLLNAIEEKPYSVDNFPDVPNRVTKKFQPLGPTDKVSRLISRAKKHRVKLDFFNEFIDPKLRNAIFHSDYTLYGQNVRILKPREKEYSEQDILKLLNRAKAYIETFFKLFDNYTRSYEESEVIKFPEGVISTKKGQPISSAITIIREKKGLIGLKDNWSPAEKEGGCENWRIGHFIPYEIQLIAKGKLSLPKNRRERINGILSLLPDQVSHFLAKRLDKIKWLEKYT
ncbi:MAG: hypothetical protein PHE48_02800 [Candidatus Daviesbacteria bacterium]|nr:hypothetical protein [Candidatus Daviesbacteria bacterium]